MKRRKFFIFSTGFLFGIFAFIPTDKYFEIARSIDIYATLFKEINNYYVDEVNPNTLMRTGIDSMLNMLDPYTNYIPEDEIEDYRTMNTGQYGGIGATIDLKDGNVVVLMSQENLPAQKAGLKIGDRIFKINGIDISGKNVEEVNKMINGQANTKVKLLVQSFAEGTKKEIEVIRENIKTPNVPLYLMVSEDVGYIQLSDFTSGASREVREAMEKLKTLGATKLILDLRGNPGGLLTEAVNVSNLFIAKELEVVKTKGKITEWNNTYRALNEPADAQTPLIVLTNGRSASAAEIVAGVIQDYDRGVLIGQKSFGKGLVQATRPLSYNSQLKITTAKYYIPSGRCIQALDYSHRNQDGTVGKFPDSLKTKHQTKNGRTVYAGEGLDPDIAVEQKKFAPISVSLKSKYLIFDYANEYYHKNPDKKSIKDFKLTEEEYQNFVKWLKTKNYDYTSQVERTLKKLEEKAREEKYYGGISQEIQALKAQISHNKDIDLQTFKNEIKALLEIEIAARYFYEKGMTEVSFKYDEELQSALRLHKDMEKYKQILQGNK